MRAVVLAAGMGSRFRPLTRWIPKPMLPLFDVPIIEHNLRQLRQHGVKEVFINLHHLPFGIVRHLGDGGPLGLRIRYSLEPEILGTTGALKKLQAQLGTDPFLVVNSDTYRHWDLQGLVGQHRRSGATVTMLLSPLKGNDNSRCVHVDSRGRVSSFPKAFNWAGNGDIATDFLGIYVMEPHALHYIPPNRPWHLHQLIASLSLWGLEVQGHLQDAYWMDLGTVERYAKVHAHVLKGICPLRPFSAENIQGIWKCVDAHISSDASVIPPAYVGEGAQILPNATVGPFAVVGKQCKVGQGATVRRSILWEGQNVPSRALVEDVLLTPWCSIEIPKQGQTEEGPEP